MLKKWVHHITHKIVFKNLIEIGKIYFKRFENLKKIRICN